MPPVTLMASDLTDDDLEAIAQRAADLVLDSAEFYAVVKKATAAVRRRESDAATNAARAAARAQQRRETATEHVQRHREVERQRAARLVELWHAGVPREEIAAELGFTRPGFEAEVHRLRRNGERLKYRSGID